MTCCGSQDPSKKYPIGRVILLSQDCSTIPLLIDFMNWFSTSPEVLLQVEKVVLATAQTLPVQVKDNLTILLSTTTLTRVSKDLC